MSQLILEAMKEEIERHTWETTTPLAVLLGPIPPGFLNYPAIGVFSDRGIEPRQGRGYADTSETFSWTLAEVLDLTDLETTYMASIAWRAEARTLARKAVDGHWGLGHVQLTRFSDFDSDFLAKGNPGSVLHLAIHTLKMEVDHREQI